MRMDEESSPDIPVYRYFQSRGRECPQFDGSLWLIPYDGVMKTSVHPFTIQWRHAVLLILVMGSLAFVWMQAPIRQDLAYHHFVDTRMLFGIPNFYNVISNLPFLFVGIAGLNFCRRQIFDFSKPAWTSFFLGLGLVSLGSAYYHLNPGNQSLVWDRLPMTLGFMGLFAALLGEFVHPNLSKHALIPLVLSGASSVLIWQWSDDLRFYAWIQFMPVLVIPFLLLLYPKQYSHSGFILLALLFYVLAKVLEAFDSPVFTLLHNEMAGHAIKHVFAAMGGLMILCMLKIRTSSAIKVHD